MKIHSAEFQISVASPDAEIPSDLPHVAFSGRSNVGKSSLINTLLRRTRKKIAHVSGRPGKTQMLNFFRVNDRFYLVDLPGFGFARVPTEVRQHWHHLIESYLGGKLAPCGIVHLLDVRRGATDLDLQMLGRLAELQLPTLVVVTKIDKLKRAKTESSLKGIVDQTGLDEEQLVPFSSVTGEGREVLLAALDDLLLEPAPPSEAGEGG